MVCIAPLEDQWRWPLPSPQSLRLFHSVINLQVDTLLEGNGSDRVPQLNRQC
ncbi:uncharacterized protein FTOL_00221 [Fusarium torulosum]|uniref:Uncharacterized protein n=1 Tax=Fusarium torulosum TaxID=33205 RepID=A0AAE8LY39_9HYPO|nr:uncharacterized protein FTOL_00221 [Fusarium torulosum]